MFDTIILTGDKYTPTQSVYFITENQIGLEEFLFNLGFEEKEYTFYKPRNESTLEIVTNKNNLYEGSLMLDKDIIKH